MPALGCTEPIAVTLAVAHAKKALGASVESVAVMMSANIYKNGMGVGIPGTGRTGLPLAAALGVVTGDPQRGLELLEHVTPADIAAAQRLIDAGKVEELRTSRKNSTSKPRCAQTWGIRRNA